MKKNYTPKNLLTTGEIIIIANRMLYSLNKHIVEHNEQTAFIALRLAQHRKMGEKCSIQNLFLLSLFHTIGFFQKDVFFDSNLQEGKMDFFSGKISTESKYVYGSYYLEYMTFLGEDAVFLETFNHPFDPEAKKTSYQEEYKSIIYLAARISNFLLQNPDAELPSDLNTLAPGKLDPLYIEDFNEINKGNAVLNQIKDKSYIDELKDFARGVSLAEEDADQLERLLIYFLDFKSTSTVKHIINTSCYAISIGKRLNFTQEQLDELFASAILHDIGKIATPQRILEFPGKLTPEDMGIMRYHVNHSRRILKNQAPEQVIENVYRHHEKLNGTGYPKHISEEEISETQRILTISDITSALSDSRSYKEEFSKEKVMSILQDMTDKGELDKSIIKTLFDDFDQIKAELPELQKLLATNYSKVITKYNDYVFSTPEINEADFVDELEDIDEQDEEQLDELEEL